MAKYNKMQVINARERDLTFKRTALQILIQDKKSELGKIEAELKKLAKKKQEFLNSEIEVSDHAILRYQERVEFLPKEKIMELILTDKFKEMVDTCGPNGEYPISDTVVARVSNRKVITIFEA